MPSTRTGAHEWNGWKLEYVSESSAFLVNIEQQTNEHAP